MTFDQRQRGQIVRHLDPNQYGQYLGGTRSEIVSRAGNSTTLYADTLIQRDETAGLGFRVGYGAAGFETWLLDITKSSSALANFSDKSGQVYNVKAWGAIGDGVTNDTAAVQAAVDAIKLLQPTGPQSRATLFFPFGTYSISSINLAGLNTIGMTVKGAGPWQSRIAPNTAGVHVFDGSGVKELTFEDLQIGSTSDLVTIPKTAILLAQVSGGSQDVVQIVNCYISGNYSAAAVWIYGIDSSRVLRSRIYNYSSAASTCAVMMTHDNLGGVGAQTSTYTTTATGEQGCSDWEFVQSEIHSYNTPSTGAALWLDGVSQFAFIGGNITTDVNGAPYVRMTDGTSGALNANVAFRDMTFYGEGGPSGNAVYVATGVVDDLILDGCNVASTYAVVQFATITAATRLRIQNTYQKSTGLRMIGVDGGASTTLHQPQVHCHGQQVDVGASGIINGGDLFAPGTITSSGTMTATSHTSVGATVLRGALTGTTGTFSDVLTGLSVTASAGHLTGRHVVGNGTALVAGDFALGAGFGSTGAVSAVRGTDTACTFTVTPGGTGISNVAATVTLTFKHVFTATPNILCLMNGGAGANNAIVWLNSVGTNSVILQPLFTPVTATAYTFTFFAIQ